MPGSWSGWERGGWLSSSAWAGVRAVKCEGVGVCVCVVLVEAGVGEMIWGVDTVLWPDVRGAYMLWCGVGWSHAVNTHGTYRLRTVPMVQVRGEGYYPGTCLNCAAVMQDLCRLLFGNVDTLMPSARHVSSEDGIGTVAERSVVGLLSNQRFLMHSSGFCSHGEVI